MKKLIITYVFLVFINIGINAQGSIKKTIEFTNELVNKIEGSGNRIIALTVGNNLILDKIRLFENSGDSVFINAFIFHDKKEDHPYQLSVFKKETFMAKNTKAKDTLVKREYNSDYIIGKNKEVINIWRTYFIAEKSDNPYEKYLSYIISFESGPFPDQGLVSEKEYKKIFHHFVIIVFSKKH